MQKLIYFLGFLSLCLLIFLLGEHEIQDKSTLKILTYLAAVVLVFLIFFFVRRQMVDEKYEHDPLLDLLKNIMEKVHPAVKNLEVYKSNTGAYTLNKKQIFLCLHDDDGNYYDLNSLIYIFTHEIAHYINPEVGHGDNFQRLNAELLERAEKLGIYNPKIPVVSNYKGT